MGWLKGIARMKAPSNRLLVVSYGSVTSYSELNCLEFSFCLQNLENSRFCRRIVKIRDFAGRILTAKQSVFLRIQVRASSQTKGLERGWKQRSRRVGRARLVLNYATLYRLPILRKKPTVLRSKRISKIQDSRVPKNLESARGISAVDATRILYTKLEQLVHRSQSEVFKFSLVFCLAI